MTRLRNENLVLVYGDYDMILDHHKQIYAYTRTLDEDKMLILLNFTGLKAQASLPESLENGEIIINNYDHNPFEGDSEVLLEPYQALVMRINTR